MNELIDRITDKDDKAAYEYTKRLIASSADSPEYYGYLSLFASFLSHKSSFVRTRAFALCCAQARWDEEGRLDEILPDMLKLLHDEKPTVVRQCLKAAAEVIRYRPHLAGRIGQEAAAIDLTRYRDSMAPLIQRDVAELLKTIRED